MERKRRFLNLAAAAAVILFYAWILLSCGESPSAPDAVVAQEAGARGQAEAVASSPPPTRPSAAADADFRRWSCRMSPEGAWVQFNGAGTGKARVVWNGPGPARYNLLNPPSSPEFTLSRGQSTTLDTPGNLCSGSYQVDVRTNRGDVCWGFINLRGRPCPLATPTPEPSPPPSPTPSPSPSPTPLCQPVGRVTVHADTHVAGTFHYEVRVGATVVWEAELARGEVASFSYPINGDRLELWLDVDTGPGTRWEHDASTRAKCSDLGQSWDERLSFSCKRVCP